MNIYHMNLMSFIAAITPVAVSLATKLVIAAIILIVGFKLSKLFVKLLNKSKLYAKLDPGVQSFFNSFLSIAVKAIVLITAAGYMGIPMTSFITILGSMAVAIGLSLQGSLSNIAGGIIILIFKPFAIGDFVSINGSDGTITEIGLFYTYMTTADNRKIIIPNGVASNNVIVNATEQTHRRVDLDITTGYDADIEQVKAILLDIAKNHPLVLSEPDEPMARLAAHGDSALGFVFRVWCKTEDYWTVRFDLLEKVKTEFDKNGISIPYPQLDVHFDPKNLKDI